MESFEISFLVRTLHRLLQVIHPVHAAVQGRNVTIGHTRRNIEHLAMVLSLDAGNDKRATAFYQATREKAIEMRIELPTLPRGHAVVRRRGNNVNLEVQEPQISSYYLGLFRKVFTEAVYGIFSRYV